MSRFDIHRCHWCGRKDFEDNMLDYNDHWFCGLPHKLMQERKDDEALKNGTGTNNSTVVRLPHTFGGG